MVVIKRRRKITTLRHELVNMEENIVGKTNFLRAVFDFVGADLKKRASVYENPCCNYCGEYRSRTGDLLHAMQAL